VIYRVISKTKHSVQIERASEEGGSFPVEVDKVPFTVAIRKLLDDGRIKTLMVDHRVCPVEVQRRGDGMPVKVYLKGIPFDVDISRFASTRLRPPMEEAEVSGQVDATLPGQILSLLVERGDKVEAGMPVLILEAMKMENEVLAPRDGVVGKLHVEAGQVVAKGDPLFEIIPDQSS
jgi:biotin carboxyl carrier protein